MFGKGTLGSDANYDALRVAGVGKKTACALAISAATTTGSAYPAATTAGPAYSADSTAGTDAIALALAVRRVARRVACAVGAIELAVGRVSA